MCLFFFRYLYIFLCQHIPSHIDTLWLHQSAPSSTFPFSVTRFNQECTVKLYEENCRIPYSIYVKMAKLAYTQAFDRSGTFFSHKNSSKEENHICLARKERSLLQSVSSSRHGYRLDAWRSWINHLATDFLQNLRIWLKSKHITDYDSEEQEQTDNYQDVDEEILEIESKQEKSSGSSILLSGGALGVFSLSVFVDGFRLQRQGTSERVEISNLSGSISLVTDWNKKGLVRSVVVHKFQQAFVCRIHFPTKPNILFKDPTNTLSSRIVEEWTDPLFSGDTNFIPCAPAGFGPSLVELQQTITGILVLPPLNNANGCHPFESNELIRGGILFVQRGVCTFEEKVRFAQAVGFGGVIIQNNEPEGSIFVMGSAGTEVLRSLTGKVVIPSVMIPYEVFICPPPPLSFLCVFLPFLYSNRPVKCD